MKPSNESDRGELEPDAPRGARPVLRGRDAGDSTPLPGKEHADPLYSVARYTTAQAAEMLGLSRFTVQAAIRRGTLESELASPNVRLISQAAIDAYRAHHLGQVGQPSRKKRRMTQKAAALQAVTTTTLPSNVSTGATDAPNADDGKEA